MVTIKRGSNASQPVGAGDSTDRGAAALEFALLAPVLVMLLFGIVTGGLTYYRGISVTNAAREAGRFGSTLPMDQNLEVWLTTVTDAAIAASAGSADGEASGQYVCVAFVHPDGNGVSNQTARVVESAGNRGSVELGDTCFLDGRPDDEPRVQVQIKRNSEIAAVMFERTVALVGQTVTHYDRASSL